MMRVVNNALYWSVVVINSDFSLDDDEHLLMAFGVANGLRMVLVWQMLNHDI